MDIFNIKIEFDSIKFKNIIEDCIKHSKKGYACVVDMNVLAMAQKDLKYQKIIRESTVNTCDGSSIALLANKIYKTEYHAFNGPDVFEYYIEKPFKHLLVGNTLDKVEKIKNKVIEKGCHTELMHLDIPFVQVDKFDYKYIAECINKISPDFIWVSLGAPKQEIFMSMLLPYIKKGMLIGIGAAFIFYIGELNNSKKEIGGLRFIWLERLLKEPRKQWKRVIRELGILPKMIIEEKKRAKIKHDCKSN